MRTIRMLTLALCSLPSLAGAQAAPLHAELPPPPPEVEPAPPPESMLPPPDVQPPVEPPPAAPPLVAPPEPAPLVRTEPALTTPPQAPKHVPVRLVSTNPKVTFYGRTFDPPSALTELCRAPCQLDLPTGPYELALTDGTVDPVAAGRFDLQNGGTLLTSFKSRDRVRRAGLGVLSLSALLGGTFTLLASSCDNDDPKARYCKRDDGFRVVGATLLTAGVISGLVMVLMPDKARVEWLRAL